MSERIPITEDSMIHESWFAQARVMTLEKLPVFIDTLANGYRHDYGTAARAVAAAAIAAAWAMSNALGITGYQAGFVKWDFIKNWYYTHNKLGLKILDYDDLLYPQYLYKFKNCIDPAKWDALRNTARMKLVECPEASPSVRKYWEDLVAGKLPDGFELGKE